jgi:Bacterial SH3 domain
VTAYANDLEDPAAADLAGAGDHLEGEAMPTGGTPGTRFITIASDGLRVRGGAGTEFEVRSVLPFGTPVVVLSRSGDWALIDTTGDGGADGFVYSAYLKPA